MTFFATSGNRKRRQEQRSRGRAGHTDYQWMVALALKAAGFQFLIHSHMLRHSTGYKLAGDGRDARAIQHHLGHRSIGSIVCYTALARASQAEREPASSSILPEPLELPE